MLEGAYPKILTEIGKANAVEYSSQLGERTVTVLRLVHPANTGSSASVKATAASGSAARARSALSVVKGKTVSEGSDTEINSFTATGAPPSSAVYRPEASEALLYLYQRFFPKRLYILLPFWHRQES